MSRNVLLGDLVANIVLNHIVFQRSGLFVSVPYNGDRYDVSGSD